jgi:large subunit ribosomal protein L25
VDGGSDRVLLRDFQMHPWKQEVLHVDFQRVDPNKKIHMRVPLHFMNAEISPGVKSGGGVVTHALNDLEIVCLPDNLPEYVEVDLKDVELNDIIHVNDLKLPQGVEPIAKLKVDNPTVASVHVPKVITVEEEAAAPVTEITGQAPEGEAAAAGEGEKKEAAKEPAPKEAGKDEKK